MSPLLPGDSLQNSGIHHKSDTESQAPGKNILSRLTCHVFFVSFVLYVVGLSFLLWVYVAKKRVVVGSLASEDKEWLFFQAFPKLIYCTKPLESQHLRFPPKAAVHPWTAQGLGRIASYIVLNAIIVRPKARSRHATAHNWHERFDTWVKLLNLLEAAINCRMIGCHIDTTHTDTCYVYVL